MFLRKTLLNYFYIIIFITLVKLIDRYHPHVCALVVGLQWWLICSTLVNQVYLGICMRLVIQSCCSRVAFKSCRNDGLFVWNKNLTIRGRILSLFVRNLWALTSHPRLQKPPTVGALTFSQSAEVIELHVWRQRHVLSGDVGLIRFLWLQIGRVAMQKTQRRGINLTK